ncbi:MAG TPA: FKBP-type peptidyl-prolyl cis-trans isomerase [Paludibacteraceae bacterium]|jgi:FKBP-type peptidyl-prolyl cis-trans isomerase|nr:FKBP-type peptidyl-prolyl cis-trans isomerase [Paludibacteraceae bacterium]
MRKIFVLSLLAIFLITSAEAKKPKKIQEEPPVQKLTNTIDSMSYALGLSIGSDFIKNLKTIPGGQFNIDWLIQGFTGGMKKDSTVMTTAFANNYFREYITKAQSLESAKKKEAADAFMEKNKTRESVITTESGLQYEILACANGPKPSINDTVKVNYQGFLPDSTKFDSTFDRGEPAVFALNQVIPGWSEGLQLMTVGSKYKFYIPYELAYGEQGAGGVIPPYSPLIFEVELLQINPAKK